MDVGACGRRRAPAMVLPHWVTYMVAGVARRWEGVRLGQQAAKPSIREIGLAAWGGWELGVGKGPA
jgi:hypothetical protein